MIRRFPGACWIRTTSPFYSITCGRIGSPHGKRVLNNDVIGVPDFLVKELPSSTHNI